MARWDRLMRLLPALLLTLVGCASPAAPAATGERTASPAGPAAQTANPVGPAAPAAGQAAPAVPAAETAVPAPLRPLQVPLSAVSGSVTPVWVAAQAGLFRRHGIDAEIVTVSPATAIQAILAGSAPITPTGSGTVSAWVSGATDLVFVGGGVNRAVFKVMGRPDVGTVAALRGKTLGNTAPSSSGTLAMFETLRRFGLEVDRDYTMTYLREQSAVLAALLSNAIQGTVLGTPLSEEAEAQGMRVLVDMRDLQIDMMSSYVTATRQLVAREPDLVQRFLMAYLEGMQLARDDAALAVEAIMRGSGDGNRQHAEAAYAVYRPVWDPWPAPAGIQGLLDYMDEPEAKAARPEEMIDLGPLRELERSGWLAEHVRPPPAAETAR
jgi:NitT/TauT family transport system substrate-binding protein